MAILSNELRIGNNFHYGTKDGKPVMWECDTISRNSVVATSETGEIRAITSEQIQPIPLTPDILEKCPDIKYSKVEGVTSFEEPHNPDEDTHWWSFNVKATDVLDSHEICLVMWGKQDYFTFQLGRGTYRQKIKYVHTFQNLIHSLTGTELEITF